MNLSEETIEFISWYSGMNKDHVMQGMKQWEETNSGQPHKQGEKDTLDRLEKTYWDGRDRMTPMQLATFFQSPFNLSNEQVDELAEAITKCFIPCMPDDVKEWIEKEAERKYSTKPDNWLKGEMGLYGEQRYIFLQGANTVLSKLMPEIERLKDALHRDETGLAQSLEDVRKILDGHHWLTEGRGPYAWNDERYKGEVLTMLETIGEVVDKGLSDSGQRAHAYCCGKAPTYEEQRAEIKSLKENHYKLDRILIYLENQERNVNQAN